MLFEGELEDPKLQQRVRGSRVRAIQKESN